jgi:plasmid stability protein
MSTMIQIRNVPDKMHRRIKVRAATAGMSMSEYLLREIEKIIERPSRDELLERVNKYAELDLKPSPTELLRKDRDSR